MMGTGIGLFLLAAIGSISMERLLARPDAGPQKKKKVVVVRPAPLRQARGHIVHRHPVVRRVTVLPQGHHPFIHRNRHYHYHNGFYYWHAPSGYVVIGGPVGYRLTLLPAGHRTLKFGGASFYYYLGTYYTYNDTEKVYTVVDPPIGSEIEELPEGYETAEFAGVVNYHYYGTFYKQDKDRSSYIVVKPGAGLVVKSIPYDYETVTRDGRELLLFRGVCYEPFTENGIQFYRIVE